MNRMRGTIAICGLLAAGLAHGAEPSTVGAGAEQTPVSPFAQTGNPAAPTDDSQAAPADGAPGDGADGAVPIMAPIPNVTPDPAMVVAAHNKWRGEVGAPALAWSDDLAAGAAQWTEQLKQKGCALEHSSSGEGENLYWASPIFGTGGLRVQTVSSSDVVDSWGQEKQAYDPGANACRSGQVCGHYTQVVWSKSTQVGCAAAVCTDRSQVWVCRYRPAGNMMGERPF